MSLLIVNVLNLIELLDFLQELKGGGHFEELIPLGLFARWAIYCRGVFNSLFS